MHAETIEKELAEWTDPYHFNTVSILSGESRSTHGGW